MEIRLDRVSQNRHTNSVLLYADVISFSSLLVPAIVQFSFSSLSCSCRSSNHDNQTVKQEVQAFLETYDW